MIKGLTDQLIMRRDGKIRAGTRSEGGKLDNPNHFLLHDAPQLIPVLGSERPTEIYFTVYDDDVRKIARDDLRWYTKSELMCMGDGAIAAYYANGDVQGLKQTPHPTMPKSRERVCTYRNCPEYRSGNCGEHIFLDMVIPQYSMASVFTLDNTSINAVLNIMSGFQKAMLKHAGKLSGQIFRLYKKDVEMPYQNPKTGQKSKSMKPVIHLEYVSFEKYEKEFKDKIHAEDWEALMALRNRTMLVSSTPMLEAPGATGQIEAPATMGALPPPPEMSEEDAVRARANDPVVLPLFEELASLRGKPSTEEARYNTAKMVPDVGTLVDWLKKAVAADKKKAAAKATPTTTKGVIETTATAVNPPVQQDPATVQGPGGLF